MGFRQVIEHVARFVCPAALHRLLGAEDRVDRSPQSLRAIDAPATSAREWQRACKRSQALSVRSGLGFCEAIGLQRDLRIVGGQVYRHLPGVQSGVR